MHVGIVKVAKDSEMCLRTKQLIFTESWLILESKQVGPFANLVNTALTVCALLKAKWKVWNLNITDLNQTKQQVQSKTQEKILPNLYFSKLKPMIN